MRFELAPSVAARVLTAAFALCCAISVVMTLAPRIGGLAYLAGAALGLGLLGVAAQEARRRPDAVEIGPDGMVTAYRACRPLREGRLQGFAQWSGLLLALEFKPAAGRSWFLSIPADAVGGAEYFRDLAVRVRQCERAAARADSEQV